MRIERLRVQNFRSFREIDIQLPAWGAVVGANASGKSNFVQVFRFLRDVVSEGFENAISLQGGVDYLRNMRIGAHMPLQVELSAIVPLQGEHDQVAPSPESSQRVPFRNSAFQQRAHSSRYFHLANLLGASSGSLGANFSPCGNL
jgi:predicted ATP-dependent endonuclease of OLD family